MQYIELAEKLAHENGLKYLSADNEPMGVGDGRECCGTEKLKDYRLFDYNLRSLAFGMLNESNMCNTDISYILSSKQRRNYYYSRNIKTLKQLIDLDLDKDSQKKKQLSLI
jgi:hypothetical protein